MRIVRNLSGGSGVPPALDLLYNGDLAADSTTVRYKGSLVKFMDYDDIDHGHFYTFAGLTTAMENVFGILEENQPATGNYLPDDATYGMARRRVTPIVPGSVIRAEYVRADAAAADNTDTSATGTAGSSTFTVTITTADSFIGGWVYFVTGSNAGYLHYVTNNDATTATFATALKFDALTADTWLAINPANTRIVDFNATYTDIKSEIDNNARPDAVVGLNTLISAPGIGLQYLDRNKHDGLKIDSAKFYHDFLLANTLLSHPIATS